MAKSSGNLAQENAELRRQLAERTAELAARNSAYSERIAHQAAANDVLKVMSASPGDPQPVFDLIVKRARDLCDGYGVTVYEFDGMLIHWRAATGVSDDPSARQALAAMYPMAPTRESPSARAILDRQIVHIRDLEAEPGLSSALRGLTVKSNVSVPLMRGGTAIGALQLGSRERGVFSESQVELLKTFAEQAVIAITSAETYRELQQRTADLQEALEQQTATAEVLQVINSSPGELAPVFEALLEKALRLCGGAFGVFQRYDGEFFHAAAVQGMPPALAEFMSQPFRVGRGASTRRLANGESIVHIADMAAEEQTPGFRAMVELGGGRTVVFVALRREETLLGFIAIYRQEVRPFSDKQIALLQNFAAQAVIAMENARLITETREALDQQIATSEVLQVINSSPGDLAPVFDAILEKARSLCGVAFGSLELYDGENFRAVATVGFSDRFAALIRQGYPAAESPDTRALVEGQRYSHILDLAETDAAMTRSAVEFDGHRTLLCVPLRRDDQLLGMIASARKEVRAFSDKEIALLQNFAAQAVIAMENARLINETREALEQQTATAEVLQVINSSPGDLAPVFDTMLAKALDLCEAAFGALITVEGAVGAIVALRNVPSTFVGVLTSELSHLGPETAIGRAVMGRTVIQIADVAAAEFFQKGVPLAVAAYDLGGIRSIAFVPLLKDAAVIGVFVVFRQEVQPFTDKQIALLQNFAQQAVIAMENARLLTETREALEQQTATAEVLQVINSSPGELQPVFDIILEKAMALCGVSEGDLELYDGNTFRAVATLGLTDAFAEQVRRGYAASDNPATRPLIAGERFSHIVDMANADFSKVFTHEPAKDEGHGTLLCVPLRREGRLLGMIASARKEVRPFSEKEIALLQNFAAQAVIAMENARLLGELRQRTEEVAELNRGLEARVAEQVEELSRVGRLKRFLAPQLAEMIVSQGDENILEAHRREIVVVFCDLRGYTAFTETAEPEEVLDFLREYHGALGPLVSQFEGTLDQFSGDGIMVFFNDPVPIPDPAARAVEMAVAMREAAATLIAQWRRRGRELGFGAGIAQGYATLGQIGFSERSGYTAIGTVCNVAARLCAEAKDGQILVSQRVAAGLDGNIALEEIGPLALKGLTQPIVAFNVALDGGGASRLRLV